LAALAAALSADAIAQTHWLPAGLTTPGNTQQTSNWRGSRRHQIVFHPQAVPSVPAAISALVLRADTLQFAPVPVQLDVNVTLASQGVPLPTAVDPTSYAANLGPSPALVLPTQRVTLPAGPGAFIVLPFATQFAYQNGAPLLVRIEFSPVVQPGIENPTWLVDAHDLPTGFWGTLGTTSGPACPAPGRWRVSSHPFEDEIAFLWDTTPAAAGAPAFLFFGTDSQHFGGIALPMPLGWIGAPGCALQTSVDALYLTSPVLGGGFATVYAGLPLPRDPGFVGTSLHAQAMLLDPAANAAGLRMSELRTEQLAVPPAPILTAHSWGSFAPAFPNDRPALTVRNHTLVLGLQ
jgi:hypothetical protein